MLCMEESLQISTGPSLWEPHSPSVLNTTAWSAEIVSYSGTLHQFNVETEAPLGVPGAGVGENCRDQVSVGLHDLRGHLPTQMVPWSLGGKKRSVVNVFLQGGSFSWRIVPFLMGTRSRGECREGRHGKQKEIITLDFFSYQFCNLKLPWRDMFQQSSSHLQTKELFSLPPPCPPPSLDVRLEKNDCRHCLATTTAESLLETCWVRFMSTHRKRERKGGEKISLAR